MTNQLSILSGSSKDSLSEKILSILSTNNKTVAVAESCTGGLLGAELSSLAGSSKIFNGGFIVYTNNLKEKLLNVSHSTLEKHGAVSEPTVLEMANSARLLTGSDYALSISGIAGPGGGSTAKPVGTVCFGYSDVNGTETFLKKFTGNRHEIRIYSVLYALDLFLGKINK